MGVVGPVVARKGNDKGGCDDSCISTTQCGPGRLATVFDHCTSNTGYCNACTLSIVCGSCTSTAAAFGPYISIPRLRVMIRLMIRLMIRVRIRVRIWVTGRGLGLGL